MKIRRGALRVLAGSAALQELRADGFDISRVGTLAGASGGPKWLVLAGLDQVLAQQFAKPRNRVINLVGSSIGAWRMACYALPDPVAALRQFEEGYIHQRYSKKTNRDEISSRTRSILTGFLGSTGAARILSNDSMHLHVITVLCHGLGASENRVWQGAGMALAALSNRWQRQYLAKYFSRVLFADPRSVAPFLELDDFGHQRVSLSIDNLADSIIASGAIPLLLSGVSNISGAPAGVYRDGGVLDYHLDLPLHSGDGLCLYPHFYSTITPGWFDKRLLQRTASPQNFSNTILLAPDDDFVRALPGSKIPDRTDFQTLSDDQRIDRWAAVAKASVQLAEEWHELMETGSIADVAEPLELNRH